ncbi:MAG: MazG family protein, partial [Actinomycetota bacterium]|nr:MazG family protein [Actinomycetota bacterium]
MVGRLVVLLTTPRLPAGLLSAAAWRTLGLAAVVAAPRADLPLVRALIAEGREVDVMADASAVDLLALAADRTVVWVSDDQGPLSQSLAADVVRRSEQTGAAAERLEPEVEILVGSFDPVGARLLDLVEVMDRLRTGCPWDRRQTHDSLVRYLLEETYETIDAIGSGDREHLREELGDLLLQVVFHARIGSEDDEEPFSIDDVAAQIVDKLVRRHPHVFGDVEVAGAEDVEESWDAIKAAEKGRTSTMDGIPTGLPALSLA